MKLIEHKNGTIKKTEDGYVLSKYYKRLDYLMRDLPKIKDKVTDNNFIVLDDKIIITNNKYYLLDLLYNKKPSKISFILELTLLHID